MRVQQTDLCSFDGAAMLARRIAWVWEQQGYRVQTRIDPVGQADKDRSLIFCVRSDMQNGLPVKRRGR